MTLRRLARTVAVIAHQLPRSAQAAAVRSALSPFAEELLEQAQALRREDAFDDLHAMVQQVGIGDPELAAYPAEAQVARAEDQAANAGGDEGAGAHDAGFERNVECGVFKPVIPGGGGSLAECEHFRVRRGVMGTDRSISSPAGGLAIDDEHGAHRHLACRGSLAGEGEGLLHPDIVAVVQSGISVPRRFRTIAI